MLTGEPPPVPIRHEARESTAREGEREGQRERQTKKEQVFPTVDEISYRFQEETNKIKKLILFTTANILSWQLLKRF